MERRGKDTAMTATATAQYTILLVDDDHEFRARHRTHLEAAGFSVIEAEGRIRGLEILQRQTFDLAIVDLMMEEMDAGFVLCYAIKKRYPRLPIIMVTGVVRETGVEFSVATAEERAWIKADVLLEKPVRPEQLHREIQRLLKTG